MTRKFLLSGFGVFLLLFGGIANADVISPYEACVNIDSDPTVDDGIWDVGVGCFSGNGSTPGNVIDGINADGLGTVTVTVTGIGAHFVGMFVDFEIDEGDNTYFNEYGDTGGAVGAGQSWEIDEPSYIFGDIYFDNFLAGLLDNTNAVPFGNDCGGVYDPTDPSCDDVSMALGWDFILGEGETATIGFLLGQVQPTSGFWLYHTEPDDVDRLEGIFFSSTLDITGGVTPVPEPGTLWLLGAGLLGLGLSRRRQNLAAS